MLGTLQVRPPPVPVSVAVQPASLNEWITRSPKISDHRDIALKSSPTSLTNDTSLRLPRILCLHGGGTNARIFRSQCRGLRAKLGPYFRLVFAEAPFYTTPGPDVVSVYEKWGPFRAWFPPGYATGTSYNATVPISHSPTASKIVLSSIEQSIEAAMNEDDDAGGTGPWIGLLGFSQGAKMAASLLLQQQEQDSTTTSTIASRLEPQPSSSVDYRFAVLLAGRAPMVRLSPGQDDELSTTHGAGADFDPPLYLPTIHVHGLKDPGLPLHRELLDYGCEFGSTRLIEWDGEHRVPIRSKDVKAVVDAVLGLAKELGVIGRF